MAILRTRRERLPWFPTINCEVCLADLECLNFCPADVFDWDPATGKPVVARPFDCIPGCRICAENCKAKGISLPGKKEVTAALKRIRAEDGLPCPPGTGKGWGRAVPQASNKTLKLPSRPGAGKGWGRAVPQASNKTLQLPSRPGAGKGWGRAVPQASNKTRQLPSRPGAKKGWGRVMPQGSNKNRAEEYKWKPKHPENPSAIKPTARGNKATE